MKWKPNNNRSCTNADNSTCIINNNRNYFDENYTKHVFIYSRRAFQRDTLKWPCMCSIYRFLALFERERTCIYVIESTLTLLSCLPACQLVCKSSRAIPAMQRFARQAFVLSYSAAIVVTQSTFLIAFTRLFRQIYFAPTAIPLSIFTILMNKQTTQYIHIAKLIDEYQRKPTKCLH